MRPPAGTSWQVRREDDLFRSNSQVDSAPIGEAWFLAVVTQMEMRVASPEPAVGVFTPAGTCPGRLPPLHAHAARATMRGWLVMTAGPRCS
jgi:hypothetical protein